jgi:RNA polymerase-associated protein CTR9
VLRKQAEELAEKRKIAREQAYEWTKSSQLDAKDSDDEKEQRKAKKASRPRVRADPIGSGDEQEQKKKKRGKLRKNESAGDDDGLLFSGDEDESRPATKKVRAQIV